MRTLTLPNFYRSSVGFEQLTRLLEAESADRQPSYPPYNIELVSDDKYRIVMAIAGFERSEVGIVAEGDSLLVSGRKTKDVERRTFLHRGIAARDFEQKFQLANHVKVTGASIDNGMLTIDLIREIPEALKPRKIEISGGLDSTQISAIESRQAA